MNATKTEAEKRIQAIPGNTQYPGIQKTAEGLEFTVEVMPGKTAFLMLYDKENEAVKEIPFPEESRRGNLLSLLVNGIARGEVRYNYRIDGEVVQDSYGEYFCNVPAFGQKKENEVPVCSGYKREIFHWTDKEFKPAKLSESVLYKMQVRSFTMHKSSKVRKKGSFFAVEQKIPYLQELGVTGVLFMPVYEYREIRRNKRRSRGNVYLEEDTTEEKIRVNCWGYTGDASYFAPKAAFAATASPVKELKHLVNELHRAGLECLLEFYFDGSVVPSMMLDILRFWRLEYHIDGFHLMGSGICRELFTNDPLLADCKLFFHDVGGETAFKEERSVSGNAAEYNDGFLYAMRHILKGDENMLDEFMFRTRRNPSEGGVINYMADQNGFTMSDMVSYEERHNEANGENNDDGAEYNCAWNCGTEGPSRKQNIKELRFRQLKNAFSMLLFSQGTPLIFQGDEFGNSQNGNNNAWCQDNETGWVDWSAAKRNAKLLEFVKKAIAFRKENGILHMEEEPKCADYKALGYPDLSYHGNQAWFVTKESGQQYVGMMYCGDYCKQEREFLYIGYNFHWISHELALPGVPDEISWKVCMSTDKEWTEEDGAVIKEKIIEVPSRTIVILKGKQDENACGSGNILRRLQGTSF